MDVQRFRGGAAGLPGRLSLESPRCRQRMGLLLHSAPPGWCGCRAGQCPWQLRGTAHDGPWTQLSRKCGEAESGCSGPSALKPKGLQFLGFLLPEG